MHGRLIHPGAIRILSETSQFWGIVAPAGAGTKADPSEAACMPARQEAHNAGWSRCPPASRPLRDGRSGGAGLAALVFDSDQIGNELTQRDEVRGVSPLRKARPS